MVLGALQPDSRRSHAGPAGYPRTEPAKLSEPRSSTSERICTGSFLGTGRQVGELLGVDRWANRRRVWPPEIQRPSPAGPSVFLGAFGRSLGAGRSDRPPVPRPRMCEPRPLEGRHERTEPTEHPRRKESEPVRDSGGFSGWQGLACAGSRQRDHPSPPIRRRRIGRSVGKVDAVTATSDPYGFTLRPRTVAGPGYDVGYGDQW